MAISLEMISTGVELRPPKICLYGVGGIGKTTWASKARKPIFIFTEEGQGMINLAKFPICKTWVEVIECLQTLANDDHQYETVVIDTIDVAEPMLWRYTALQHGQDSIDTNGGEFGFGRGYLRASENFRVMLDWCDVLRAQKGMVVILLAHSEPKKFSDPEMESYDRYSLRMHRLATDMVYDWSDAVLFANFRTTVVKDQEGFGSERKRGVGLGERLIYTERRPAFVAKNRYSLPPQIQMDWAEFESLLSKLKGS